MRSVKAMRLLLTVACAMGVGVAVVPESAAMLADPIVRTNRHAPAEPRHPDVQPPGPVHTRSDAVRLRNAAVPESGVRQVRTGAPFSLVGVKWSGAQPDSVQIRHLDAGGWSDWTTLDPADDSPEVGKRGGASEPLWTGPAQEVQVRASRAGAPVTDELELVTVDPGAAPTDRMLSGAEAQATPGQPSVVTRAQWGADESIMTWTPEYASTTKAVAVHHTAGTNDYTCDQSASIVRGIYRYHALTNGWGDIGYNVLVDKCGTVFEGRAGGLTKPIIGAHAGGFNTYTFGISMLGTFTSVAPTDAQIEAVSAMAAWKLAGSYRDPRGSTVLVSAGGGTARWPAGTAVTMPTIFGHRDTGNTECPGNVAYGMLDRIRDRVVQLAGDWRSSPVYAKWQQLGGDGGFTGGVFGVESALEPGGRTATFAGGDVQITWHASTGAHWMSGGIRQRYFDSGGPSALGFPSDDQGATAGVAGQYLRFGPDRVMIWGQYTGARFVSGAFLATLRAGGDVARYGLPRTEQVPVPGRAETMQEFEQASIVSNAGNIYTVGWAFRAEWQRQGGYAGRLGPPTGNLVGSASAGRQSFAGGSITCGLYSGRTRCTVFSA
jgi:uncharacterized protein with LGFP repeats